MTKDNIQDLGTYLRSKNDIYKGSVIVGSIHFDPQGHLLTFVVKIKNKAFMGSLIAKKLTKEEVEYIKEDGEIYVIVQPHGEAVVTPYESYVPLIGTLKIPEQFPGNQ